MAGTRIHHLSTVEDRRPDRRAAYSGLVNDVPTLAGAAVRRRRGR
ncbi:MAG TPA: hypothetical protein VF755_14675 [Catenuloplanes sp.]